MNPNELPLLALFNRLRKTGMLLGIEEYMSLLRALQAGFGVGDRHALKQLCCTLWVKSGEEAQVFHRLFEEMLQEPVTRAHESSLPEPPPLSGETAPDLTPPSVSESVKPSSQALTPESRKEPLSSPTPAPPSGLELGTDELVEVVKAVRHGARGELEMRRPRFALTTEYLPVTRRRMRQVWRQLRRPVREGTPEELDVVATVEKVGREGILLQPVLVPRLSSRSELVLLIDYGGSMVPFHILSRQLVETAQRGGQLRQVRAFYFHDYPGNYLYRDPAQLFKAGRVADVLESIGKQSAVIIVSDAGAARGRFDSERINQTEKFVEQLRRLVRSYAWLNPMPNTRWLDTTAGEIAHLVPMFEMSRQGLSAAISLLRGRYVYWEKMYPWMM